MRDDGAVSMFNLMELIMGGTVQSILFVRR